MENEIKLADIFETFVQRFNKNLDQIEDTQF